MNTSPNYKVYGFKFELKMRKVSKQSVIVVLQIRLCFLFQAVYNIDDKIILINLMIDVII